MKELVGEETFVKKWEGSKPVLPTRRQTFGPLRTITRETRFPNWNSGWNLEREPGPGPGPRGHREQFTRGSRCSHCIGRQGAVAAPHARARERENTTLSRDETRVPREYAEALSQKLCINTLVLARSTRSLQMPDGTHRVWMFLHRDCILREETATIASKSTCYLLRKAQIHTWRR